MSLFEMVSLVFFFLIYYFILLEILWSKRAKLSLPMTIWNWCYSLVHTHFLHAPLVHRSHILTHVIHTPSRDHTHQHKQWHISMQAAMPSCHMLTHALASCLLSWLWSSLRFLRIVALFKPHVKQPLVMFTLQRRNDMVVGDLIFIYFYFLSMLEAIRTLIACWNNCWEIQSDK